MFTLDIKVNVRLNSGAEISLTEAQNKSITNYVTELVLGKPDRVPSLLSDDVYSEVKPKPRGRYSRKKTYNAWTIEEDVKLLDILKKYDHIPKQQKCAERQHELKEFRRTNATARTMSGVNARYAKLRRDTRKADSRVVATNRWGIPITVKTS